MLKSLAHRNGAPVTRIALLFIIIAVAILNGLVITGAQQTPQSNQQQRPRRVSGSKEPTPGATPRTSNTPTPVGEEVGEGDVVRVDTQLVSVPAVVTDRVGHPLSNLRAENFVLYEDGRPQQISNFTTTEAPFEIVLLLDTSGSTRVDLD